MSALMAKVAELANVNKSTVSRVFNGHPNLSEETRQRVLLAAEKLDYIPNKRIYNKQAQNCIGILIDKAFVEKSENMEQVYSSALIHALINAINQEKCFMLSEVYDFNESKLKIPNLIKEKRVAGLVLMGISAPETFKFVKSWKVPSCSLGIFDGMPDDFPGAEVDCVKGMFKAVSYLIALGHHRIALVNGSLKYRANIEKQQGYKQALKEFQLDCCPEYIFEDKETDSPYEFGYSTTQKLLKLKSPPSAIVYMTDLTAMGGNSAIKEAGLTVPDDISIFGFDDSFLSLQLKPHLSTVNLNLEDLARNVVEIIVRQIRKLPQKSKRCIVEPHIVVRESCSRFVYK